MILQSLVNYYEQLLESHPDRVARVGWCSRQVACIVKLSAEGKLIGIIPTEEKRGEAKVVPQQEKRSSGVAANVLCDNATYFFGLDSKGKPERARQCFDAAKNRHLAFLEGIDSPNAAAVLSFFREWNPENAVENPTIALAKDSLLSGGNLVFQVGNQEVLNDPAIQQAWDRVYRQMDESAAVMTCLVSGKKEPIARLHPSIKGIMGAQSMGASLVGFNARAFESYGHDEEQGLNAPVSEYATFAYTTALNYLLADRSHHMRLGDTTIVYWAAHNDDACSGLYADFLDPGSHSENDEGPTGMDGANRLIDSAMKRLAGGQPLEGVDVNAEFFVLGIAPNAARLSVRFFYHDAFGAMLDNLRKHYERLDIVHAPFEKKYLTPYWLLSETENPNAKQTAASSTLGGALMRSILGDQPYPASLYEQTILRVQSTQDNDDRHTRKVTRGRVAIVKAYLLKNCNRMEEEITVSLNEERNDIPYVLGRLFSVLERIQKAVNPEVNSTIKNKYYDSASTTPSVIFPIILKLSDKHLAKLEYDKKGSAVYYEKLRGELLVRIDAFPKRLSLEEQGDFILGYYHQTQKFYEKNESKTNEDQEV